MKENTHPEYQKILFVDSASGHRFVCGSTLKPNATEEFEGTSYPVYYLSISSSSHPFFTGSKQLVDSEGRVEKFKKRFGTRVVVKADADADADTGEGEQQSEQKQAAKTTKPAKSDKAAPAKSDKAAPAKSDKAAPAKSDKAAPAKKPAKK